MHLAAYQGSWQSWPKMHRFPKFCTKNKPFHPLFRGEATAGVRFAINQAIRPRRYRATLSNLENLISEIRREAYSCSYLIGHPRVLR